MNSLKGPSDRKKTTSGSHGSCGYMAKHLASTARENFSTRVSIGCTSTGRPKRRRSLAATPRCRSPPSLMSLSVICGQLRACELRC
ncbi:hypothetical protein OPV22_006432 [Ensete ventricosum]|uniref:Uncharacterized protein n=1 Tax=Ensete ventricosum TaxID=4639 RepID=A0AAV8RRR4_ENSVE|nr:hypothetical protein OPV22_006432 [Ensete ventricosum]